MCWFGTLHHSIHHMHTRKMRIVIPSAHSLYAFLFFTYGVQIILADMDHKNTILCATFWIKNKHICAHIPSSIYVWNIPWLKCSSARQRTFLSLKCSRASCWHVLFVWYVIVCQVCFADNNHHTADNYEDFPLRGRAMIFAKYNNNPSLPDLWTLRRYRATSNSASIIISDMPAHFLPCSPKWIHIVWVWYERWCHLYMSVICTTNRRPSRAYTTKSEHWFHVTHTLDKPFTPHAFAIACAFGSHLYLALRTISNVDVMTTVLGRESITDHTTYSNTRTQTYSQPTGRCVHNNHDLHIFVCVQYLISN